MRVLSKYIPKIKAPSFSQIRRRAVNWKLKLSSRGDGFAGRVFAKTKSIAKRIDNKN